MKLSVAVCTWNRQDLLGQTLAKMQELIIPGGVEWELLVVNNNCSDGTDEVIERYARTLPIRRVFEPVPGLSNARNAAVRAAAGDYILWTDDDVLVDGHWIEAYAQVFALRPEVAVFGGPIVPWFEGTPPSWLLQVWPTVSAAYAVRDLGPRQIPFCARNLPFGANYAMSLPQQRRYLYDPQLGRIGKGMLGGEETSLIQAMLDDGLPGLWVPESRVSHFVPHARQNIRYLRRFFHGQGLYLARVAEGSKAATVLGYPRWLVRRALEAELGYWTRRLTAPPGRWIEDLIEASKYWGQLQGYCSACAAVASELQEEV